MVYLAGKREPKVDADGTYHCPCGVSHKRGPVNGVNAYRCLKCGHVHAVKGQLPKHLKEMSLVVNLKQMTLDDLTQLQKDAQQQFNQKEIAVLQEINKTVRALLRPGAVALKQTTFDGRVRLVVTRRVRNNMWYRTSIDEKKARSHNVNLQSASYSFFTQITSIRYKRKVVYNRTAFLKKHKVTCLKGTWAFR